MADFSPENGDLYFINTEVSSLKAQNSKNSYFEIKKNKGGNGFLRKAVVASGFDFWVNENLLFKLPFIFFKE